MNRILVVASNSSLAIGLAVGANDVIDLRPRQLSGWIAGSERADVAVLALPSRDAALAAVAELQAAGCALPVALVSNSGEDWSAAVPDYPCRVETLPLPLGRPELLSTVDRLLHPEDPAPPPDATPVAQVPMETDEVRRIATPGTTTPEEVSVPQAGTPSLSSSQKPSSLLGPGARDAGPPGRLRVASRVEVARARLTATELNNPVITEASAPPDASAVTLITPAQPAAGHPVVTAPPQRQPLITTAAATASAGTRAIDLVRQLLRCIAELESVEETAQRLADAVSTRTAAAATAVLLPDGTAWEVAAGTALRPLELRCQLSSESWLVSTVALDCRGVLIDQTDIARQRLAGAPLAGRQQLLAAPVPGVKGIVLAGRDDRPFTAEELTGVAALGERAAGELAEALDTRSLAREMDAYCGLPD